MAARFVFYCLKLPFILVLILFGLLFEFVIEAPFIIAYFIDQRFRNKK